MKHLYKLLFVFLLLSHFAQAQMNLVPNSSFEDTVSCPFGVDNMINVTSWYSAANSPDYFHSCANSTSPLVSVPDNYVGYQAPLNGNAYAGISTYVTYIPNHREHIGVPLSQPLEVGIQYFVSAYISRGDTMFLSEVFDCATDKFGFRFSTFKYESNSSQQSPVDNFAHVFSDNIILDSLNWVQISGSFIADSTYSYLNIGNFFDDINTDKSPCQGLAYYYIDNVCVSTSATTCEVISSAPTIQNRSTIKLYPNPATDKLSVSNLQRATAYTIFSSSGQVRQQGQLTETDAQISVVGLAPGLYFLQLPQMGTFKFVVSR